MTFFQRVKRLLGMGNGSSEDSAQSMEMISCQDALSFINEFLDGEHEGIPYEDLKAHFDVCQRCYPHLKLEESFRESLHRAQSQRAPEELRRKVSELLSDA